MITPLSFGHCALCGQRLAKQAVTAHLRACVSEHAPATGVRVPVFHLHVKGRDKGRYWIDLEIKGASKLRQLDAYLRQIWLECCGHLSAFEIGRTIYSVSVGREWSVAPCPYCLDEGEPFCCTEHVAAHACGEPEAFLPVVNSPRMGGCGYTGEI